MIILIILKLLLLGGVWLIENMGYIRYPVFTRNKPKTYESLFPMQKLHGIWTFCLGQEVNVNDPAA